MHNDHKSVEGTVNGSSLSTRVLVCLCMCMCMCVCISKCVCFVNKGAQINFGDKFVLLSDQT